MPVHRLRPALVLSLALVAIVVPSASAETPVATLRVLFVGNSLTQTNDLPQVVAALASAGGRRLEWRTVAFGGFNLADHWQAGVATTALAEGGWDVVVLQQGPSALPESQADLLEWATRFADAARSEGTQPALFTVWPESYRQYVLPQVIASYRNAAAGARAQVLPGGGAWQLAWRCSPGLPLYGGDGFHPSPLGTYTAALAVYGRLFRAPLAGLPSDLRGHGAQLVVAPRAARVVQWAAARSLGRKPALPSCGR